jgi:hypothetical protein
MTTSEELRVESLLKHSNPLADRRRGDVQLSGGQRKTTVSRRGFKGDERVEWWQLLAEILH